MREKRKKNPLNVQIGLRIKQCRLNRNMTQEHVSELPDVTRQYVSGLERGVTGLLLQHSSTCAKSWLPAPTTFCWTNGQVPTRCSMPGSISSKTSRRRRFWTLSKTSHSLRNCPGSKKTSALKTEAVCFMPCSLY
ncbi:helix-turn-helix domain-containing protein [Faecalibaculum rodentium]|uniref:helix-turn-helix domain-containing protein n=1 Tax=Faecalibaculum rodentium TaxID=1702221 RepID=UPI003C6D04C4